MARHVVILAGGRGTRFWPLGRASRPKQLLALDGDDPRPLLRATYDRVRPLTDARGPWLVTTAALGRAARRLLPELARERLVLEPEARNTAAAVAVAAHAVACEDPDATLVVVPADHHVSPERAYRAALAAMLARAGRSDAIVTLGLAPSRPATGFGYLEVGRRLAASPAGPVHEVRRFVEKPTRARAARFVAKGRHLWNAGTFAFRPRVLLDEVARRWPEGARALAPVLATRRWRAALARSYAAAPSISIDHAVMERAGRVETVRARFGWDDLGSFDAVHRHGRADAAGNVLPAASVAVDAHDNLVRAADGTTVALLGVEGLVVVRTKDALLVARRDRVEEVRRVVDALKVAGREDLLA